MTDAQALPMTELQLAEMQEIRGGDAGLTAPMVALGVAIVGAAAAGWKWGYENLGPQLNKWF
jgi:hypothetical protein